MLKIEREKETRNDGGSSLLNIYIKSSIAAAAMNSAMNSLGCVQRSGNWQGKEEDGACV